jgi:hypothetical protein
MKKRYEYNSPKGAANNAAKKQGSGTVSPINKNAIPPVAARVKPAIDDSTDPSTDKGKKS